MVGERGGVFVPDPQPTPFPSPLKRGGKWPNRRWKPDLSPKAIFKNEAESRPGYISFYGRHRSPKSVRVGGGVNKLERGSLSDEVSKCC